MDVLQLLDDELKTKSNWSLEEKARYLYIRSCELFSYDARYQCDLFWTIYGEEVVEKEIINKKIDLRNVTDFLVVCTSYSSSVINGLLGELLNVLVKIHTGNLSGHQKVSFEIGKNEYYADATSGKDIAGIKIGLETKGYYSYDKTQLLNLKEIDRKIGYNNKKRLFNSILRRRICNLEEEFIEITGQDCEKDKTNYFLYQMQIIKEFFDKANIFKEYIDAFFCIEYLLEHFFCEDICLLGIHEKDFSFNNHNLVDIGNDNWNFVNVFDTKVNDEKFSFLLEPINGKYEFREIPISEGDYYKKELRHYKKRI